eukprot:5998238-Prymnesium_polylepis.2
MGHRWPQCPAGCRCPRNLSGWRTGRSAQTFAPLAGWVAKRDWQCGHRSRCSPHPGCRHYTASHRRHHRKCRRPDSGRHRCIRLATAVSPQSTVLNCGHWPPDRPLRGTCSLQRVERSQSVPGA